MDRALGGSGSRREAADEAAAVEAAVVGAALRLNSGSARAAGAEWALANSRGEYKACRAARQGGSSLFTQYELIAEHEQKRGLQNWY